MNIAWDRGVSNWARGFPMPIVEALPFSANNLLCIALVGKALDALQQLAKYSDRKNALVALGKKSDDLAGADNMKYLMGPEISQEIIHDAKAIKNGDLSRHRVLLKKIYNLTQALLFGGLVVGAYYKDPRATALASLLLVPEMITSWYNVGHSLSQNCSALRVQTRLNQAVSQFIFACKTPTKEDQKSAWMWLAVPVDRLNKVCTRECQKQPPEEYLQEPMDEQEVLKNSKELANRLPVLQWALGGQNPGAIQNLKDEARNFYCARASKVALLCRAAWWTFCVSCLMQPNEKVTS